MKDEGRRREDQWFYEQESKLIEKMRRDREARLLAKAEEEVEREREALKKVHWMCCPKCGHPMEERELQGIDVDICTRCEGIFFDRGEIEELLLNKGGIDKVGFFRKLMGFTVD